jgi:hypothetical protein
MAPVISEVSGVTFLCVPGVYDAYLVGWLCYGNPQLLVGSSYGWGFCPYSFKASSMCRNTCRF